MARIGCQQVSPTAGWPVVPAYAAFGDKKVAGSDPVTPAAKRYLDRGLVEAMPLDRAAASYVRQRSPAYILRPCLLTTLAGLVPRRAAKAPNMRVIEARSLRWVSQECKAF